MQNFYCTLKAFISDFQAEDFIFIFILITYGICSVFCKHNVTVFTQLIIYNSEKRENYFENKFSIHCIYIFVISLYIIKYFKNLRSRFLKCYIWHCWIWWDRYDYQRQMKLLEQLTICICGIQPYVTAVYKSLYEIRKNK